MGSPPAWKRYCRCGTRLAADNTGGQCARCERASRDKLIAPPEVPAEFWQTEQLRDAFAAQHIGRVARAYRLHPYHQPAYGPSGISQGLLGQWLGLSQPQVSRIETGPPIRNLDTLAYWARVLWIPAGLLWFRLPGEKGELDVAEPAALLDAPGNAGELVRLGDSSNLAAFDGLRCNLNDAISENHVTNASLDDWEQNVAGHGRTSRDRPPAILLADLSVDLAELHHGLNRCRSLTARRHLTRTAAQMAGLMCLALIKLDHRSAFRGWARTARVAASEADDAVTHSWVRAQEAYGHYYSGDFAEALAVAQHAQRLVSRTPCVGAVLAAALEARAHAARGDHHSARTALGRAEVLLSLLDDVVVTDSAFGYTEAQLRFHEGNAFTHLHDTALAWPAQQRALELCPSGDYMDRTLTLLDRADCLAHDGELDSVLLCMAEALGGLSERQRQGIITARARTTLAALPPAQRTLPAVRELRDLLTEPREV